MSPSATQRQQDRWVVSPHDNEHSLSSRVVGSGLCFGRRQYSHERILGLRQISDDALSVPGHEPVEVEVVLRVLGCAEADDHVLLVSDILLSEGEHFPAQTRAAADENVAQPERDVVDDRVPPVGQP